MINSITKNRIKKLHSEYSELVRCSPEAIYKISTDEVPEMVYNSNAIENSTLTLQDTEDILLRNKVIKGHDITEVYEAKNLANITEELLKNPGQNLTPELILTLHELLLRGINDDIAGRFRHDKEWVHVGANPAFVQNLTTSLVDQYHENLKNDYFLSVISYFHAEFKTIHPFNDGNGRIGRVLINQQLMALGYPPIIIRDKSKRTDYYPLLDIYQHTQEHDEFTDLFALLLLESLHKRITMVKSPKIIPLSEWAKKNDVKGNVAANKAARQTIPAFRVRERWMIAEEFVEGEDE